MNSVLTPTFRCPINHLIGLFTGNETFNWKQSDFINAATWAQQRGIDTLYIKVNDGPNEWYNGQFDAIYKAVTGVGINVIPYGYMYGYAKGSDLKAEIAIALKYMDTYGAYCGDIETEWNGQVAWAVELNAALQTNTNLFYASVLADPTIQNMNGVLDALTPSVNVWMPQVYTDFLNSVWHNEFYNRYCVQPTLSVNGPTDVGVGVMPISIWEYSQAQNATDKLSEIVQRKRMAQIKLSASGEVGDFVDVDQMQPAHTQFACGYFTLAIILAMAAVGMKPAQTVIQMIAEAESWYAQYDGDNGPTNTNGMSDIQEYQLLHQIGYHYQASALNADSIRAWVKLGYPVVVGVAETSVYDIALGGNPYPWTPAGNHIFAVTGVASDGNFLVRDPANCTDLFDPTSLRQGPRHYDANKLSFVSATAIVPHWLPQPPAGFDPLKDKLMVVPNGWKDDGKTLTAPNGIPVINGFRLYILNNTWNPFDVPQVPEHGANPVELAFPQLGGGTRQEFAYSILGWKAKTGVYLIGAGAEVLATLNADSKEETGEANATKLLNDQLAAVQVTNGQLSQQVADLTKALADCKAGGVPISVIPTDVQAAINAADASLKPFVK